MSKSDYYLVYVLIGLTYWAVNVFVRKLPDKNDPDEGWVLAPAWMLLWPIYFIVLIVIYIQKLFGKGKI